MADKAYHIAWERFVQGFAFVAENLVRAGEAHLLLGARMMHGHVALEPAGTNAHERNAVAMLGVHVRLNLENESGERGVFGSDKRRAVSNARADFSLRPARGPV